MADRTRGYAIRIDIDADAARVWRALIDPVLFDRWCAKGSVIKAREGGSLRVTFDSGFELDAHIDVFVPGRRLRLVHMPVAGRPKTDSVIVDDLLIEGTDQAIVRLLGSGFPEGGAWDTLYPQLRRGWERAISRLKVLLEKNLDKNPDKVPR
jgi:uncharacterized protein YndB with AHSA1/START domain